MPSRLLITGLVASVLAVLPGAPTSAQGPFAYYPDDNTPPNAGTPAGWYPWFTNTTGVRYQIRVPASAFAGLPTPLTLSSSGFHFGATNTGAPATFSLAQIRIGPSAVTALTNTFATNLVPGSESLVADVSGSTYPSQAAAGVWVDIPFSAPYTYASGDLILDIQTQIPSGGSYLNTTVSSLVPRLINAAYTGQPTGTLTSSSGIKVRFGYQSGPTEYQLNQPAASLLVNGVQGSAITPAAVSLGIGSSATASLASINAGFAWEVGIGAAPLVPRSAGGLGTADGDVLNLDATDPSLFLLWNLFQSPPFASLSIPYPTGGPSILSVQLVVADPIAASGIRISQPSRITVQ